MKWVDIPPVWLAGCIVLSLWQARALPEGLRLAHPMTDLLAGLLIGAGLILMLLAVSEMRRQKTTVIPHLEASHLVQSGIFSRTRNPIYLGDALVLTGLVLRFDAVLSLVLVPAFVWIIERRFIVPEENRLRRAFRADYARYERKVRRWV
ncbi:MAG: isoprenylcysteine carboxylmethyltransferase family protein [Rhodobacteraceae bacterium]|nr:isoprenylcysteine carboxylmethyltransferase family protein [Paracoccaceae bacterium]